VKIFISADIEGISGVVHGDHAGPGRTEEYPRARRLMTRQVNAAVEGAVEGGAETVIVNDSHGSMRNILIEDLHPKARLITGSPKPLSMMQGVEDCRAALFIGYHSAAGTPGVLSHTYSSRTVHELRIQGRPAGETLLNAGIAGYYGVPVLLVVGDGAVAEEAAGVLPGVRTVAVKEPAGRYAAACLPLEEANGLIREAAREAVQTLAAGGSGKARAADAGRGGPAPLEPPSPITFQIRFMDWGQAEAAAMIPGVERIDPVTLAFTHSDYIVGFKAVRAMIGLAAGAGGY